MKVDLESLLNVFDVGRLSLWGPFGLLILCGLGLPIPEDLVLIVSGFLAADNDRSLWQVVVLMYVGILVGDLVIYGLGRNFGRRILGTRLGRFVITEERLIRAEVLFQKYGRSVVFVGRFLPGLRAPVFFSAGLLRFPLGIFLAINAAAALVSAPLFVWLGHWAWDRYSENLEVFEKVLGRTKIYLGFSSLALAIFIFYWIRRRSRIKDLAQ